MWDHGIARLYLFLSQAQHLRGNGRYIIVCKKENVDRGGRTVLPVRYEYEKAFFALHILSYRKNVRKIWTFHEKKIKIIRKS